MFRSNTLSSARKSATRAYSLLLSTASLLGGVAALVRWKTREAARLNPPAGRFISVDGVRLHYVERGSGPVLVFLHGNVVMSQDFTLSPLVDLAAKRYRVIVFDRPGFGYSERPKDRMWTPAQQAGLLHKALLQMGVERPYILGHSWGAFVALELALRYPESIAGVILASGYYHPTIRLDTITPTILSIPGIGDLMGHSVSPAMMRAMWPSMLRRLFEPAEISPGYDEFPVWLALRPSQLRAAAEEGSLMVPSAFAFRNRLQNLSVPTMIVAGEGDKIVDTEKESVRLHHEVPGSQLRIIKGAGHMIHHSAPQEVMDAIDELATMPAAHALERGLSL
ncbi:MAG TPA: alpha/beta hydrolase [Candidatus Saccharimonadales bacterium]|nr:alpha/beta hydrolase [Candidatus Saccharimonadales bacterium]